MGEIVGQAEPAEHKHNLPKQHMFGKDRIRRGAVAKCDCGEHFVWEYHYDSQGGYYAWAPLRASVQWKLPRD